MEQDPGFISVEDAIKLIEKHTLENPTVDLLFMMDNFRRIKTSHNFLIPLAEKKNGKTVRKYPSLTTTVYDEDDRTLLRRAIRQKFEAVTGKKFPDVRSMGLRKISNAVDDQHGTTARQRQNSDSKIKLGDTLQSGSTVNTNTL